LPGRRTAKNSLAGYKPPAPSSLLVVAVGIAASQAGHQWREKRNSQRARRNRQLDQVALFRDRVRLALIMAEAALEVLDEEKVKQTEAEVRDWLDWPEFKQVDALREANITLHLSARGVAFRLLHVLGNGADYRHNAQLV
jgi:hypothetical protein